MDVFWLFSHHSVGFLNLSNIKRLHFKLFHFFKNFKKIPDVRRKILAKPVYCLYDQIIFLYDLDVYDLITRGKGHGRH